MRSDTAAAVDRRRLRRDGAGAADFAVAGRRAGAGLRRAEIRRARAGRSGAAAARNISLDDVRTVVAKANSSTPVGTLTGPDRRASRCSRPARSRTPRLPRRGRRLPQRRAGQAQRDRASVIDSVENDKIASWYNEHAPSCWRSSASPTPTPSRWSTGARQAAAACARRCRRRSDGAAVRPLDLDPRRGARRAGDAGDRHLRW